MDTINFVLKIMGDQGCSRVSLMMVVQNAWTDGVLNVEELTAICEEYGFEVNDFYNNQDMEIHA